MDYDYNESPEVMWKILDKHFQPATFLQDGFFVYTLENIISKKRERLLSYDSYVVGDIVWCPCPGASIPSEKRLVRNKEGKYEKA